MFILGFKEHVFRYVKMTCFCLMKTKRKKEKTKYQETHDESSITLQFRILTLALFLLNMSDLMPSTEDFQSSSVPLEIQLLTPHFRWYY